MRVRMKVNITGARDGEPWPKPGETIDVPEYEGRDLIGAGYADEVMVRDGDDVDEFDDPVTVPEDEDEPDDVDEVDDPVTVPDKEDDDDADARSEVADGPDEPPAEDRDEDAAGAGDPEPAASTDVAKATVPKRKPARTRKKS